MGVRGGDGKSKSPPSRRKRDKDGAPVIFQEVVHSIGTGEAVCVEQSSFRGQTEWTTS